jgi:hypothetical protein
VELGAEDKDGLEWSVCVKVCAGTDDAELAGYQRAFTHNWIALLCA